MINKQTNKQKRTNTVRWYCAEDFRLYDFICIKFVSGIIIYSFGRHLQDFNVVRSHVALITR